MRAGGTHRLTRARSGKTAARGGPSESEPPLRPARVSAFWLLLRCALCLGSFVLGVRITQEARLVGAHFHKTAADPFGHSSNYSATDLGQLWSGFSGQNTSGISTTLTVHPEKFGSLPEPGRRLPDTSANASGRAKSTGVYVGRHPILVRRWPHPDPAEMAMAYSLIARVQREQWELYGIRDWRPVIVITPTYVRTFQAVHLTGLMHTLSHVPGPVTWIVIEAGGVSAETTALLTQAQVHTLVHLGSSKPMPPGFEDRGVMESHLRVEGLRYVRERKLEGVVVFADDSNVYSRQFFDEVQKVKWVGALPVAMLGHAGFEPRTGGVLVEGKEGRGATRQGGPAPPRVQGPACDFTGTTVGWHTSKPIPLDGIPTKGPAIEDNRLEWAGFVLNARAVWAPEGERPDWVKGWAQWARPKDGVFIDLRSISRDEKYIEALANCGHKEVVLLWWARMEARADSKFPSRWALDTRLSIVVPARSTPWPDRVLEPASPPPPPPGASGQSTKRKGGNRSAGKPRRLRRRSDATKSRVTDDPKETVVTNGTQT